MEAATSTFYAGANQLAAAPAAYLWTPLIILAAGILMLTLALTRLTREDRRAADLARSIFDD